MRWSLIQRLLRSNSEWLTKSIGFYTLIIILLFNLAKKLLIYNLRWVLPSVYLQHYVCWVIIWGDLRQSKRGYLWYWWYRWLVELLWECLRGLKIGKGHTAIHFVHFRLICKLLFWWFAERCESLKVHLHILMRLMVKLWSHKSSLLHILLILTESKVRRVHYLRVKWSSCGHVLRLLHEGSAHLGILVLCHVIELLMWCHHWLRWSFKLSEACFRRRERHHHGIQFLIA